MLIIPTEINKNPAQRCMRQRLFLCFIILIFSVCTHGQKQVSPTTFFRQVDSIAKLDERLGARRLAGNRQLPLLKYNSTNRKLTYTNSTPSVNRPFSITDCNDTSGRFSIGKDTGYFYVGTTIKTRDGNLLISGEFHNQYDTISTLKGFLMKSDLYGKILWSKFYDSINPKLPYNFIHYHHIIELKDGSILLGGSTNDNISSNNDLFFTRTDAAGNVIWTKDLYSRLWTKGSGTPDYFYLQQMKEDTVTGDVYITGPSWAEGLHVLKLDITNGNLLWNNMYKLWTNGYNNEKVAGIVIRSNEIVIIGTQHNYSSLILVYRISKVTGDTLRTKVLTLIDTPFTKLGLLAPDALQELTNGDIAISGKQYGLYQYNYNGIEPLYQAGVVVLDSNFNFRKAYSFRNNIESNGYNSRITMHPDGSGLFSMLRFIGGYSGEMLYTQFKDGVILKQRIRSFSNEGYPRENESVQFDNGADLIVQQVSDSIAKNAKIVFTKLHLSDTSSACLGRETNATYVQNYRYVNSGYAYLDTIRRSVFLPRQVKDIHSINFNLKAPKPFCEQSSVCDTFKLSSQTDTICPQIPVFIRIHKNPDCGSMVQFNYDTTSIKSFVWVNDSTYQLIFQSAWRGYIKGSLAGCSIHTDSVLITVLQAPVSLQLGPDTSICPGNQILLNAHTGYATYRWQDGSTDSLFSVTQPGTYFVTTTNACGDPLSDTIIVLSHPPISFSLGNDLFICKKDTATIIAPEGFISYQWSPAYNIGQTTGASVRVSPLLDTAYFIKAEKSPGCFAYDTIRVLVKQLPAISLGSDTSFCAGGNIVMDAGAGFQQYQWNTGANSRQLSANSKGLYSVTAITSDGCKASASLNILQIYSNPTVNLGKDSILCLGSQRVLDAGVFAQYLWNTGNTNRQIIINDTGSYRVRVTDLNHCIGNGTLYISKMINPPFSFLSSDTAICSYGEIILKANQNYSTYLWSNGQTGAAITITRPGLYWMRATDRYSCVGSDSVIVLQKECMKGLYVPTAFSPNNDGKNDLFKPLIFGNVVMFKWVIYNRYGQIVFSADNPSKGWDGTVKGVMQNSDGFIWICHYQFAGELELVKTGSVVLVR